MSLEKINLYRMTHIQNIPHIMEYGITHKSSANASNNFVAIGDRSLISTRNGKSVSVGKNLRIRLGEFIPFYFGVRMPMLYVVQIGGNFVENPTNAEDIIYLVCPIKSIVDSKNTFYFSDGHATDRFTEFYDSTKANDLPDLINWDAIRSAYWEGTENLNIKRQKQAECLVQDDIPFSFIIGFGCYNDSAKQKLLNMGVEEQKIKVIPKSYY